MDGFIHTEKYDRCSAWVPCAKTSTVKYPRKGKKPYIDRHIFSPRNSAGMVVTPQSRKNLVESSTGSRTCV